MAVVIETGDMMNIKRYITVKSLEEAYELNQKTTSFILGGCCWLRLSPERRIDTAIDLSALGLDQIDETATEFKIGCMVTLRQLECSAALSAITDGVLKECLSHIVGVQFRNIATIGGSISGRFGFSDILTLCLVLDADVELYRAGRMKLCDFAAVGAGNDIVTHIIIPKKQWRIAYESLRLSVTDFPVIACAMAYGPGVGVRCAIGARPQRAVLMTDSTEFLARGCTEKAIASYVEHLVDSLSFGTNLRGSAEYRRDMAAVLCKRMLMRLVKEEA